MYVCMYIHVHTNIQLMYIHTYIHTQTVSLITIGWLVPNSEANSCKKLCSIACFSICKIILFPRGTVSE